MNDEEDRVIDGVNRYGGPLSVAADAADAAGRTGPAPRAGSAPAARAAAMPQAPAPSNLARIARDLAAAPPVDSAKVERLRAAIISGDYRPDPAKIAERMVALESAPSRS